MTPNTNEMDSDWDSGTINNNQSIKAKPELEQLKSITIQDILEDQRPVKRSMLSIRIDKDRKNHYKHHAKIYRRSLSEFILMVMDNITEYKEK